MRTIQHGPILVVLLQVLASTSFAIAQTDQPEDQAVLQDAGPSIDDGEETARLYRQHAAKLREAFSYAGLLQCEYDGLHIPLDDDDLVQPAQPFSDSPRLQDVLDELVAAQTHIEVMIEISRRPTCKLHSLNLNDPNDPEYVKDFELGSDLRTCVIALVCDATRLQHNGDEEAAVDRLLAAYRIIHHLMMQEDATYVMSGHACVEYTGKATMVLVVERCPSRLTKESARRIKQVQWQMISAEKDHVHEQYRVLWNMLQNDPSTTQELKKTLREQLRDEDGLYNKWLEDAYRPIKWINKYIDPYGLQLQESPD